MNLFVFFTQFFFCLFPINKMPSPKITLYNPLKSWNITESFCTAANQYTQGKRPCWFGTKPIYYCNNNKNITYWKIFCFEYFRQWVIVYQEVEKNILQVQVQVAAQDQQMSKGWRWMFMSLLRSRRRKPEAIIRKASTIFHPRHRRSFRLLSFE